MSTDASRGGGWLGRAMAVVLVCTVVAGIGYYVVSLFSRAIRPHPTRPEARRAPTRPAAGGPPRQATRRPSAPAAAPSVVPSSWASPTARRNAAG